MKKALFILFFATLPLLPAHAQDAAPSPNEPTVTIRHGDNETFYDYRVNGQLVQIKVVPKKGPPYYLVPADGGGWVRHDQPQLLIPSWKILEW